MEVTYEEFINNILKTRGRFACGDEYHERHHIVPRCMGGGNEEENLIDLYAREHFEAHRLLALENPKNEKLVYAWTCMAFVSRNDLERYRVTAEEYEEARIALSIANKGRYFGGNVPGRKKSKEHRMKLSESNKGKHNMSGKNNPNYGKHMSEESKNKMSNNRTNSSGKSNYMYGKHHTEKTKDKIRRANNGQNSGENNPAYGKRGNELRTPIVQFTKDKQLIEIYESISGAERITNISHAHIISVCRNQRKTAGGYYWRYLYDQTCKDGTIIPGAITLGLITEEEALRMLEEQKETEGEN